VCYVCRVNDVPATTGYGVPVQTLFKMADGERIVAMMGFDPRFFDVPEPTEGADEPEEPFAVAVTKKGYTSRFSLRGHREPSTRAGRKFSRPKSDDEVVYVSYCESDDRVACATRNGRALICNANSIGVLAGAGRGVMLIKLGKGDDVIGAAVLADDSDALVVLNDNGKELAITTRKYEVVSRGGKGFLLFKRGKLERVVWGEPTLPGFPSPEDEA
jgi:DNA gyrase subunit A